MSRRVTLLWTGLPLLCLALYANSLSNGFHYDDVHSIVDNPSIRQLGNIPAFFIDLSTFSAEVDKGMYRPLLLVSYAVNHALGGYEVQGYRLVNILLHALNAVLVGWLASQLCPGRRDAALIAGLLFAAHPLATEPVNYISSRSESLAATFYLLTLVLFIGARQSDSTRQRRGAWLTFELGLLSKMTAVTAPLALLLYDLLAPAHRHDTDRTGWVRRHAPFWAILLIHTVIVTCNEYLTRSLDKPVRDGAAQFLTQVKAAGYYLYLILFPAHLNVEHQFAVQRHISPTVVLSLALVLTGGWLVWLACRRARYRVAATGLSWSALFMLPVMAMPLNVLVNERRLYLPAAVLCLLLGILVSRYSAPVGKVGQRALPLLVVVAVLVLSAACLQRNRVWADDFTLWEDAVHKAPMMPRGHLYLGNAHKDAALNASGQQETRAHWLKASAAYQRVIDLGSDRALSLRALNNVGAIMLHHGKLGEARSIFQQAVDLDPDYADGLVNLGVVRLQESRSLNGASEGERKARVEALRQSITHLTRAVTLNPNHSQAFGNLGAAYQDLGDTEKARRSYERALKLKADDHLTLKNLAVLHTQMAAIAGQSGDARRHLLSARAYLQRALQSAPRYRQARAALRSVESQLRLIDGQP